MKIVAVIPVKDKSERVESKNFKDFSGGLSLLELKIQHLIGAESFDKIYVSTDSAKARCIASKYQDVCILERDSRYCNNVTSWSDVIHEVVMSLPEDEDTSVAWCHVTSPLFDNYEEAIKRYKSVIESKTHDGLVTVSALNEFIISDKARPINYHWGVWHSYSQNLEKYFSMTGALFIAKKAEMLRNRYVCSSNPYLHLVSEYEAIDVDTVYDFELAKILHERRNYLKGLL